MLFFYKEEEANKSMLIGGGKFEKAETNHFSTLWTMCSHLVAQGNNWCYV